MVMHKIGFFSQVAIEGLLTCDLHTWRRLDTLLSSFISLMIVFYYAGLRSVQVGVVRLMR